MTGPAPNHEMDAVAILRFCKAGAIPANANVEAAIEAHRQAFEQFVKTEDEAFRSLAGYALRTVIFAFLPSREQAQRQVDYLALLPIEAWDRLISGDPFQVRESTLAMCAWWLARSADV